jgi:hypothetical protein
MNRRSFLVADMNRRDFIIGWVAAAPAIVRPHILMPIRPWIEPTFSALGGEIGPWLWFAPGPDWVLWSVEEGAKTYVRRDILAARELGVVRLDRRQDQH